MDEFTDLIKELKDSKEFKEFNENHIDYYLAHGFVQLDTNFNPKSNWQIGFYSKEKDNLALFELNPIKQLPFEEAFKKDGNIEKLKDIEKFKKTSEIIQILKEHNSKKYMGQIPTSYLLIIQVINGIAVYNITTITAAFSMINTRFNAKTGEIILDEIRSILDLRNNG